MSDLEYEAPGDPRLNQDYRRLSPMCFVAFFSGLASLVVLLNADLLPISILSVLFSVVVIIAVSSKRQAMIGPGWALSGLFLALMTTTFAIHFKQLKEDFLANSAIAFANEWLDLVQSGDLYRSYELTLMLADRQASNTDLKVYYENLSSDIRNPRNNVRFKSYIPCEPEVTLRQEGRNCKLEFLGIGGHNRDFRADAYFLNYRMTLPNDEVRTFTIEMKRDNYPHPIGPTWTVSKLYNTDPLIPRNIVEGGVE